LGIGIRYLYSWGSRPRLQSAAPLGLTNRPILPQIPFSKTPVYSLSLFGIDKFWNGVLKGTCGTPDRFSSHKLLPMAIIFLGSVSVTEVYQKLKDAVVRRGGAQRKCVTFPDSGGTRLSENSPELPDADSATLFRSHPRGDRLGRFFQNGW